MHADPKQGVALAQEVIAGYPERFRSHWLTGMRSKLGLFTTEPEDDTLIGDLLDHQRAERADFTNTFRELDPLAPADASMADWYGRWTSRLARQSQSPEEVTRLMHSRNPRIIPRNHRVGEALEAAVRKSDLAPFQHLLAALASPYVETRDSARYTEPPPPGSAPCRTFCGT